MNWEKEAVNELQSYYGRRLAMESIHSRIKTLEEQFTSVGPRAADLAPRKGGASRMEDSMINNIVQRQRLELAYKATQKLVELTERGLEHLDERQRLVLERFFMSKSKGNVERLCQELFLEQAQVYRIKKEALYRFTIAMYGLKDY